MSAATTERSALRSLSTTSSLVSMRPSYLYVGPHVKRFPTQMSDAGLDNRNVDKKTRAVLARNIERRMREAGIRSNIALGELSGVSDVHIGRVRKELTGATIDALEGLATALRCEPWELIADEDSIERLVLRRLRQKP